ncbi:MAG: hypothetical protein V1645_05220 [archaeon]
MEAIFWCEFPEKVDWKEAKKLIKFKTEVYVAAKTRKEYEKWAKKIRTKNIETGAWPTLTEEKGYWFSGFIEKEDIDRLKEFNGLKMKIDIEPPFPGKGIKFTRRMFTYLLPYATRKGKNNKYLEETIRGLKGRIIISGFPLPGWTSRRYGDVTELGTNMEKNFIGYTTLTNKMLMRAYTKWFAKKAIKKYKDKAMFAVGCTGTGIFGDEKTYKDIKQFTEDLDMIRKTGAKKTVIFNIEGIMQREDRKEWIKEIEKIIS